MNKHNIESIHYQEVTEFLELHKRMHGPEAFRYASYNPPNSMIHISDHCLLLMCDMSPTESKLWLNILKILKRNHEPVLACTALIKFSDLSDLMCKASFYKCLNLLVNKRFVIKTRKSFVYIVNPQFAHKLFKPKNESE